VADLAAQLVVGLLAVELSADPPAERLVIDAKAPWVQRSSLPSSISTRPARVGAAAGELAEQSEAWLRR
jgi:hypothetical protein